MTTDGQRDPLESIDTTRPEDPGVNGGTGPLSANGLAAIDRIEAAIEKLQAAIEKLLPSVARIQGAISDEGGDLPGAR